METTRQPGVRPDPEEIKELLEPDAPAVIHPPEGSLHRADGMAGRGLEFLYDVPLQISVEVGRCIFQSKPDTDST